MDRIQYLSQFNLLRSLSSEDLIEMDELTSITTFPKYTFIQTPAVSRKALLSESCTTKLSTFWRSFPNGSGFRTMATIRQLVNCITSFPFVLLL